MSREYKIELAEIPAPACDAPDETVFLSDETMVLRRQKVLERMSERELDSLVIYCDVEHSMNFEYLTGFFTRFEEALLVLHRDGTAVIAAGNENLNKVGKSRIPAKAVHVPHFSLPDQPMLADTFLSALRETGIREGAHVGVAGWKLLTDSELEETKLFDLPYFIIEGIRMIMGDAGRLTNETGIFIGRNGVRCTNNANELAHYEYGAAQASDCMMDAMSRLRPGVSEFELGDALVRWGQHTNVVTIASLGARFVKANMFPTGRLSALGNPVSLTVGYKGGLSSRAGYAVYEAGELPEGAEQYLEELAIPYFRAYCMWLETLRIGTAGGEMYRLMQKVLPWEEYHWSLCPGHLTADEEWMCSPIYPGSDVRLESGMLFQIDIIPLKAGMGGVSAESTVALADEELKAAIRRDYPELWERVVKRRRYLSDVINLELSEDVLPMCGSVAYLRPFLYQHGKALRKVYGKLRKHNKHF